MPDSFCSEQPVCISRRAGFDEEYLASRSVARLLITASSSQRVEIVARRIHGASARADRPFVQERARDLPPAEGALTRACFDLLDTASGGSLLLADVEEMPRIVQRRLLRLLEELEPARDPAEAVRLVSGSTVSLLHRVQAGMFSPKLFYRLNVIHLVAA